MAKTNFETVNEYIASKPNDVRAVLNIIRDAIRKAVPEAEELISYGIPMYKMNGRPVPYFAGWKEHYSLYPLGDALAAEFKKELADYEMSKGTIRLPLYEPVPVKLIERIAKFRVQQLRAREKAKGSHKKVQENQLDRIRRICGKMPSVSEKLSHGAPTFFVQKDKRVFTMFAENHHEDDHVAIWLPAPAGLQSALLEDAPKTYFKPPYVGRADGLALYWIKSAAKHSKSISAKPGKSPPENPGHRITGTPLDVLDDKSITEPAGGPATRLTEETTLGQSVPDD